jgi:transaldolase
MTKITTDSRWGKRIYEFIRQDFHPHFWELEGKFPSNDRWRKLSSLGTELWLDTGDLGAIEPLWTQEFCALTTNNTLLNKEVQKGIYDQFISEANRLLDTIPELSAQDRKLEIAFMLNARHGLHLVEKYDAYVSVEEHTDLANDVESAVEYARRLHAICPERFIIKIPFTPAGLLATRVLSSEGIPINHTLGFSARQNYLITRIGRPEYVNVFLGRLNAFVIENHLGSGLLVGEKATLASQMAVRTLRKTYDFSCRQIGASLRSAEQIRNLVGLDVLTIPPGVAEDYLRLPPAEEEIESRLHMQYAPGLRSDISPRSAGLPSLWEIDERLIVSINALEMEHLSGFTPDDLVGFFEQQGCRDILIRWTASERQTSRAEGKIPKLENWQEGLSAGRFGLDALMNLAGLESFTADQDEMDAHVAEVLEEEIVGHA